MKTILMAVVFTGMVGGVYAADLKDLQTLKASDIKRETNTVSSLNVPATSKVKVGAETPGVITPKQFIEALSMDRMSPILRYYHMSEEGFKMEIASRLPSDLAAVPVNYVVQVMGEASHLLPTQDGGFYTQHRVRIRETLTDMSRKFDPNNVAAAMVSNQHVWEWGCKRDVSYFGKSCEPENQLLMKEFIKIP
ncbi:MAG: hypothetical protein PHV36_14860 [Elusimicrobiales bacterium]|nr:hypothetical protein [Elusimicrobiales bacterium]